MRGFLGAVLGAGLVGLAPGSLDMARAQEGGFTEKFSSLSDGWHVAHYDFGHRNFATDWRRGLVSLDKSALGGLALDLVPTDRADRFQGAALRRVTPTHFGRYEVVLQAARGPGLVTGFFVYTGPAYGTAHDEIDIEFLGRDTTRMVVSWFVDGHRESIGLDLGFDAARAPGFYAFDWLPDRLRWYAGDRLLFETTAQDGPIPQTPARLFTNLWAVAPPLASWAGQPAPQTLAQARILAVRHIPFTPPDP